MPKSVRVAIAFALTIGASWLAVPAWAQLPQPRLMSVAPLGVRAGGIVDLTIRGTDLEGATTLWFDHPGLRAFHLKGATFRVACSPDVPVGQHDVRAVGTYGVSNPRTIVVGDRPESSEVESNNTPDKANPLPINSVVNGEVAAADIDCFAFEGKRGQRVFLDLAGERVESRIDATLRVLDPSGNEIVENRDTFGADPFLDLTLPSDGRYVVKVHDVVFAGSNDYPYRLTLHDGPHLDAISPVVAAPGVPATFTLIGRNLGGLPAPELSVDGRPVERKQVTIAPPAALELDPTHPSPSLVSSSAAVRRGFEYALTTPAGTSNRLFIAEAIDPVVIEEETNNDNEHPQEVTVPCDISGSFGAPNDVDIYRFKAKKGDVFWIEASADRLGSAADPAFLVQRVVEKAPPQDLLAGEDLPDQGGAGRFNTSTVDAGMRWPVPDDGIYQVVVSDLYSSQRGDPRLVYRLNIRPERPDFRVFLVPNAPNLIDSLTLRAGGRASAYVVAWRTDGFAGPIRVEARDLPPGVSCPPVVIAAGQAIAPIVFEAAEDAKRHIGLASLVATGHWGDRKEALTYVAGATPNGPPVSHEVLTGGMSWPPLNAQAPTVTPARLTRGFVLTILDPAPLTVTATPATWTVAQGHQLNLDLAITRREGLTEAVAVTASDLPPNLVNATATIAKEAKAATLPLFVAKTVPPGTYTFVLRATAPFPFSKDPNAKPKPNVNLSEPSNPITIVVRPAPVSLAVNNKGGALKAGAVLEVDVTVTRPAGYTDPVTLSLAAPAALKLSAPSVVIPTGQTTGKLVVTAAADSPPGAAAAVAVRATAPVRMEPVEVDEPLVLTISK